MTGIRPSVGSKQSLGSPSTFHDKSPDRSTSVCTAVGSSLQSGVLSPNGFGSWLICRWRHGTMQSHTSGDGGVQVFTDDVIHHTVDADTTANSFMRSHTWNYSMVAHNMQESVASYSPEKTNASHADISPQLAAPSSYPTFCARYSWSQSG